MGDVLVAVVCIGSGTQRWPCFYEHYPLLLLRLAVQATSRVFAALRPYRNFAGSRVYCSHPSSRAKLDAAVACKRRGPTQVKATVVSCWRIVLARQRQSAGPSLTCYGNIQRSSSIYPYFHPPPTLLLHGGPGGASDPDQYTAVQQQRKMPQGRVVVREKPQALGLLALPHCSCCS